MQTVAQGEGSLAMTHRDALPPLPIPGTSAARASGCTCLLHGLKAGSEGHRPDLS